LDNIVLLVSNDITDEAPSLPNNLESQQELGHGKLVFYQQQLRKKIGGGEDANLLTKATRESTSHMYDRGWQQWVDW
jgi:hypothetical protein